MNLENISAKQIAMAFTGSFLGAGFVSGQELIQFFGVFGFYGLLGMILAVFLFCVLASLVMIIAKRTGIIEFDRIIVQKEKPVLRLVFSSLFVVFLFGVLVVMIAGAGSLLNQIFGISKILGSSLIAFSIGLVALFGAKGVLKAFSITVPFLILVALITGLLAFSNLEYGGLFARASSGENFLLGNWFFAMLSFVSYNMMAAISILVPIAPNVQDEQTIKRGVLQGSAQLLIVFICLLLPIVLNLGVLLGTDLPMLSLAELIHPFWGKTYAIFLFCGMFGSALSCLFGVSIRLNSTLRLKESTLIFILVGLAFVVSLLGFKELIATIFPVCGYLGFLAMFGILLHFVSLQKIKNQYKFDV